MTGRGRLLGRQLRFVKEIDRLKRVLRQTWIMDGSRRENSAEHSWHLAVMVLLLHGHARQRVNVLKCLKMALIHDIPEIHAGDVFIYSRRDRGAYQRQELVAAKRLFGRLPRRQAAEYLALWREVETGDSPEARFVKAMDRLEPIMCNYATKGRAWRKHGIRASQVRAVNMPRMKAVPEIGRYVDALITSAVRKRYLPG
ncbi:MAG: HD domain-containing protein [Candidatus Coatesbacteria bacterium]